MLCIYTVFAMYLHCICNVFTLHLHCCCCRGFTMQNDQINAACWNLRSNSEFKWRLTLFKIMILIKADAKRYLCNDICSLKINPKPSWHGFFIRCMYAWGPIYGLRRHFLSMTPCFVNFFDVIMVDEKPTDKAKRAILGIVETGFTR